MTEQLTAIDEAGFKKAMSRFGSGVTVVTAVNEGASYGITVSAFSSLSLAPPLVLICIGKTAPAHAAISSSGRFAVNILSDHQEDISNRFASKHEDRFAGVSVRTGKLGLPLLEGALAAIECRLTDTLPGGDHTIFLGEVVHADIADGNPLLYYRGNYRRLMA